MVRRAYRQRSLVEVRPRVALAARRPLPPPPKVQASGKTTTAQRLHARLGGVLIRQCNVYERLGIDLRAWARRTAGFTRDVGAYERARDAAYVVMLDELRAALAGGGPRVVVDAIHGELAKRRAIYEVRHAHACRPLVVWCRCDDPDEVRRRFAARAGCAEPEHEASELSVYRHIRSLWQAPLGDRTPGGAAVPVVVYDTVRDAWSGPEAVPALARLLVARACAPSSPRSPPTR